MYTTKAFASGTKARSILENTLSDRAAADREAVILKMASGLSLDDAAAEFISDINFLSWYEETKEQLKPFEN